MNLTSYPIGVKGQISIDPDHGLKSTFPNFVDMQNLTCTVSHYFWLDVKRELRLRVPLSRLSVINNMSSNWVASNTERGPSFKAAYIFNNCSHIRFLCMMLNYTQQSTHSDTRMCEIGGDPLYFMPMKSDEHVSRDCRKCKGKKWRKDRFWKVIMKERFEKEKLTSARESNNRAVWLSSGWMTVRSWNCRLWQHVWLLDCQRRRSRLLS